MHFLKFISKLSVIPRSKSHFVIIQWWQGCQGCQSCVMFMCLVELSQINSNIMTIHHPAYHTQSEATPQSPSQSYSSLQSHPWALAPRLLTVMINPNSFQTEKKCCKECSNCRETKYEVAATAVDTQVKTFQLIYFIIMSLVNQNL